MIPPVPIAALHPSKSRSNFLWKWYSEIFQFEWIHLSEVIDRKQSVAHRQSSCRIVTVKCLHHWLERIVSASPKFFVALPTFLCTKSLLQKSSLRHLNSVIPQFQSFPSYNCRGVHQTNVYQSVPRSAKPSSQIVQWVFLKCLELEQKWILASPFLNPFRLPIKTVRVMQVMMRVNAVMVTNVPILQ